MAKQESGNLENKESIRTSFFPKSVYYYGIMVEALSPIDGRPFSITRSSDAKVKKNVKTRAYQIMDATAGQNFAIQITITPNLATLPSKSDGILSTVHIDGKHERCMYLSYSSWEANNRRVTQHHDFYSQYNPESGDHRNVPFVFRAYENGMSVY